VAEQNIGIDERGSISDDGKIKGALIDLHVSGKAWAFEKVHWPIC
jgi:hypothetical protein